MYKCECGREFETKTSRNSHYRFCKVHIPIKKYDENGKYISKSKYKITDNLYRCECGKEFDNHQSLNAHFSHCDYHHQCRGTKRKGHTSELTKSMCWNNKTDEEIKEIYKKSGKTHSVKIKTGENKPSFLNRKHTKESKEKIRKSTIKYLSTLVPDFQARYSKTVCKYIDDLNKKYNWELQHAENGGEITCGGYFLDGYDSKRNIVFEYDEPKHYVDIDNNILSDKDIERQNFIIEKLDCDFYRYNEALNLFYKVNI